MVVLSSQGKLYTQTLDSNVNGPFIMTQTIPLDKFSGAGPGSLYFSSSLNLLVASFLSGETYLLRLDHAASNLVQQWTLPIPGTLAASGNLQSLPCNFWLESASAKNTLVCCSPKGLPSSVICTSLKSDQTCFQVLKPSSNKATHVEGVTFYAEHLIAIFDDGSLSRYDFVKPSGEPKSLSAKRQPDHPIDKPIPITFFEKASNVTATPAITLAGDILQQYTSDVAVVSM
jgi:hypothetical protein